MFLHVDLDAFFSSVEQLDNPEYRGKPVIVGGLPGDARSVVSTCSYEARKFGVHSAMPVSQAYRLCPHGIFLRGRMKRYLEKSAEVMAVFEQFSPDVQQMSVDEAFIDLSGTERLFGPPENAARCLKNAVTEKTGLTVSCGLASNKYVAKIASGMQKPDGLFIVQKGGEEQFMRSLPLSKIWGAGKKTQERLRSSGFTNAEDIYRASRDVLVSIFGEAGGMFLYRAVRGQEAESFDGESKSHSLSSERTYKEDITDRFIIETAILELCQIVMFRLLRHNQKGKTVHLKIRYGDFTTVSVQETGHSDVSSVDNLFERAMALFNKKYKKENGIRLLGVGIQNISGDINSVQGQLFDFGEKKKQQVERAILDLQKKDPSVNVTKARLIKKLSAIFFAAVLARGIFFAPHISAQESTTNIDAESAAGLILVPIPPLPAESPETLFSYNSDATNIEFLAEGFWEAQFDGKTSFSFTPDSPAVSSFALPVFSQKVDLSLWFMLNKKWYFEGVFADGFEKNTIAAGYNGTGIVKSARISNRGIVFPSTYPADDISHGISGGDNQAPGISISLAGEKWKSSAAVRYDYLSAREKVWYGNNEVFNTDISASSWSRGKFFVLPSVQSALLIERVFVESLSGGIRDAEGRTYRELLPSEYLLIPSQALLVLAKEAIAPNAGNSRQQTLLRVAVTFSDNAAEALSAMGAYGTALAPGGGFLGQTQAFFGSASGNPPDLVNYAYKYDTTIRGARALVLQSPSGFSPFASGWKYTSSASDAGNIRVINPSTEASVQKYGASLSGDIASITANDFFNTNIFYIDAFNPDVASNSLLDPAVRFPFADSFPQTYLLPPNAVSSTTSDAPVIRIESYSPVSRFSIGTSAVNVRVYKNGALDAGAIYNAETGNITLSSPPGEFDRVYVTWYEENENASFGALAAGIGFSYAWTPAFELSASLTSRWSMSPEIKYADSSSPSPGFVTLALAGDWKPFSPNADGTRVSSAHSLRVKNTAGVSYETDNTTGFFRILGMDDFVPSTTYLGEGAGYMPQGILPVLNARPGSASRLESLTAANHGNADFSETKDSGISGIAVELEYDFSSVTGAISPNAPAWASVTVDLGSSAPSLASANRFELALKLNGLSSFDGIYLQLGVEADDNPDVEDAERIPTWQIDSASTDSGVWRKINPTTDWQTISVILSPEDKSRLWRYTGARIIVTGTNAHSGKILVGPSEIINPAFGITHDDAITVTTRQEVNNAQGKADVFTRGKTNYVQTVTWNTPNPIPSDVDTITLTRYIAAIEFSQHKKINMLVKAPQSTSSGDNFPFTIILDRKEGASFREAFRLELTGAQFSGGWQLLSADLTTGKVFIDGAELSSSSFTLSKDMSVVPVRFRIMIYVKKFSSDSFSFDELHLEEAIGRWVFEDRAVLSWKYAGVVFAAGEKKFSVISNPELNVTGIGTVSVSEINTAESVLGNFDASITLAGIKLSFDASASSDNPNIGNSGHSVKTTLENPLFSWLSFSEQYRYGESALTLSKENSAAFTIPKKDAGTMSLNASARASSTRNQSTQNMTGSLKTELPVSSSRYALESQFSVSQNVPEKTGAENANARDSPTYGGAYMSLFQKQFSTGNAAATRRANDLKVKQTVSLPVLQLAPHIEFGAAGQYVSGAQVLFYDTQTISFVIPFTVNKQRISLTWTKKGGAAHAETKGGEYARDITGVYTSLAERPWFFLTFPFYDLFDAQIIDDVTVKNDIAHNAARSSQYSTFYQASWARPFTGSMANFFIPSSASLSAERDVTGAANVSDVYQLKAQSGWTALNCFGALSGAQLFSWYEQDEFISSLSITAKIPSGAADSNSAARNTITTSGYFQSAFYLTNDNILRAALDMTLTAADTWNGTVSAAWNRTSSSAPYKSLINIFNSAYDDSYLRLKRTDTASFTVNVVPKDKKDNRGETSAGNYRYAFAYNHREELAVVKYVSLFVFLGAAWNYDTKTQATLIEVPAGIGGKIVF